jgi:hypothetical protein
MLARLLKLAGIAVAIFTLAACADSGGVTGTSGGHVRIVMSTASAGTPLAAGTGTLVRSTTGTGGSSIVPNHYGDGDPAAVLAEAHATIASFLARNLDGELVSVEMSLPVSVDLLALVNGNTYTLPIGTLPPATYDQIVVVIVGLDLVTKDGTEIAITPPGGGWTAIIPVDPFVVEDGLTTTVNLRFHPDLSFRSLGGSIDFDPAFDCSHGED